MKAHCLQGREAHWMVNLSVWRVEGTTCDPKGQGVLPYSSCFMQWTWCHLKESPNADRWWGRSPKEEFRSGKLLSLSDIRFIMNHNPLLIVGIVYISLSGLISMLHRLTVQYDLFGYCHEASQWHWLDILNLLDTLGQVLAVMNKLGWILQERWFGKKNQFPTNPVLWELIYKSSW